MKPFKEYSIIGGIIGIIIGALLGLGVLTFIKKSQRGQLLPYSIIGCAIFGLITGARVGYNFGLDEYKTQRLGIKYSKTEFFKTGRFWYAVTKWTDTRTGKEYNITTGKSTSGELVSELNKELYQRHYINSGSQINVSKAHGQVKGSIFSQLKKEFSE